MKNKIQFLAYYLPQFHPIPENDKWWGKGFTEWTNVTKAKPLFEEHNQPRFPADLGYYDLRVPEIREQQAQMASDYGVDGFCYYHYWFGNGKTLLERPIQEVVKYKTPNFPFMICWANETWKGIWFGGDSKETLIEQLYPGEKDYEAHFNYLLEAFRDERYIKIDGKCLFSVYMPENIPDLNLFVKTFRRCAKEAGIGDLYLLASRCSENWDVTGNGFDGQVGSEFSSVRYLNGNLYQKPKYTNPLLKKISNFFSSKSPLNLNFEERTAPLVIEYEEVCKYLLPSKKYDYDYFPCVVPDWDNTARAGNKSMVFQGSTPELWEKHLEKACEYTAENNKDNQIVFIKSWNEWAEGNYLEPDRKWGFVYLNVVKKIKEYYNNK